MRNLSLLCIILLAILSCNSEDSEPNRIPQTYTLLSLGDSYTKRQGICNRCGYPFQLRDSLITQFNTQNTFSLEVIAETGWTTSNLIDAINNVDLNNTYDLVTLLIGVNNQFQNRPLSLFEEEFEELVGTATELAFGDKSNVIIIAIPDYANTGFGQGFGGTTITEEITNYNSFIESFCTLNDYTFVDAQNLIFAGLVSPELIAPDNLHPSELAYSNLVTQLLPVAYDALTD